MSINRQWQGKGLFGWGVLGVSLVQLLYEGTTVVSQAEVGCKSQPSASKPAPVLKLLSTLHKSAYPTEGPEALGQRDALCDGLVCCVCDDDLLLGCIVFLQGNKTGWKQGPRLPAGIPTACLLQPLAVP